jgi:CubicO group peptidase (beta-lactamase class C family)
MPRSFTAALLPLLLVAALAGCTLTPTESAPSSTATPTADSVADDAAHAEQAAEIVSVVESAMEDMHLKAVLVEVRVGDETVISEAFGESMTGVPATTDMHFRNGAVAFSYISNLLLQYVDDGMLSLDDTIDQWVPELPESDTVTLLMLTNQTTGYPDFEQNADWLAAYNADPFHLFTYEERINYAFSTPLQFAPGTNWSYAHTNFMILGHILEKVAGRPLDEQIQDEVLTPMGLTQTAAYTTSYIPEPVLHAFSSERRQALGVPAGTAFTEESSFWNPAWGTPIGLAQTTTISDMATTAIAIGTGELLSDESYHAMTDSKLIGFGEKLPSCEPSCFTQVDAYNYGLGVVRSGEWMLQNPLLSGYSAAEAYLPSERIAIAVANTFEPEAFDCNGVYDNTADILFRLIAAQVAPEHAPPTAPVRQPTC